MDFKLKILKYGLPVLLIILFIILVKVHNRTVCTITPAVLNTSSVHGSTVDFSWTNGQKSKVSYINVSTSKSLKPDGSFSEHADIVNDIVTDKNSYFKSNLKPGTYYWNIVNDSCGQRKVSTLGSFTLESTNNSNCEIAPAVLGTPIIKGSKVTFSWTNDQSAEVTYINVSSSNIVDASGILTNLNIINDIIPGKTVFTKENIPPGTYYWNIVNDSCGQRKVSTLGSFTVQPTTDK